MIIFCNVQKKSIRTRSRLVDFLQSRLSKKNIHVFRRAIADVHSIPTEEKSLLSCMFEDKNLFEYSGLLRHAAREGKQVSLKTYSCQYYGLKSLLLFAKEMQIPIVMKKTEKVGAEPEPGTLYRVNPLSGHFMQISPEEVAEKETVLVFKGIVPDHISLDALAEKISRYGLESILLANSAQGSQYVPGHESLRSVTEPHALKEIAEWQQKAESYEAFFLYDHVYCNSLEKERIATLCA